MAASRDLILAIDNGTQSVRALLFDPHGNLLAKSRVPIEPYFSTAPGLAEQDPEVFWQALCQACQGLWATLRQGSAGGQQGAHRRGGADHPALHGDQPGSKTASRCARRSSGWTSAAPKGLKPLGGLWGLAFRLAGMTRTVAYLQAEAEANWIATHQPEIWAKTHKYVFSPAT